MNKIIIKIYKLKPGYSIALLFLMTYVPSLIFFIVSSIFNNISDPDQSYLTELNYPYLFFSAVCIAPFFETMVAQYLPYALCGNLFKKKIVLLSFLSGIIFGLFHIGNISMFMIASGIGFFLQLWFILFTRRYNSYIAFFAVAGVHLLKNLVGVLVMRLTDII